MPVKRERRPTDVEIDVQRRDDGDAEKVKDPIIDHPLEDWWLCSFEFACDSPTSEDREGEEDGIDDAGDHRAT